MDSLGASSLGAVTSALLTKECCKLLCKYEKIRVLCSESLLPSHLPSHTQKSVFTLKLTLWNADRIK